MRPRQKGLFSFDRLGGPIGDFGRLDQTLTGWVLSGCNVDGEKNTIERCRGCTWNSWGGQGCLPQESVGEKMTVSRFQFGICRFTILGPGNVYQAHRV